MSTDDPAVVPRTIAFGRRQFDELKRLATEEGKSFSEIVRDAVADGLHFRAMRRSTSAGKSEAYKLLGGEL